jgi:hypothetical protein
MEYFSSQCDQMMQARYPLVQTPMRNKRRRLNSPASFQRHIYMTRSQKSATDPLPGPSSEDESRTAKERVPNAHWSEADELFLVTYLLEHKPEAGDGGNFMDSTFADVGRELDACKVKGGSKTARVCKSKWSRVWNSSIVTNNN